MIMRVNAIALLSCLFCHVSFAEQNPWNQELDLTADVKLTTLGLGGSLAMEYNDYFDIRLETYMLGTGYSTDVNVLNYDIELDWRSYGIVVDFYPNRKNFHLNAGMFFTDNKLDITVSGQTSYFINGNEYSAAEVGDITSSLRYDTPAYYLGLGWDKLFNAYPQFGVNFDMGIVFQGTPDVVLSSSLGGSNTDLNDDLANESDSLETHLEILRFYPVISLGLSYRFQFP